MTQEILLLANHLSDKIHQHSVSLMIVKKSIKIDSISVDYGNVSHKLPINLLYPSFDNFKDQVIEVLEHEIKSLEEQLAKL